MSTLVDIKDDRIRWEYCAINSSFGDHYQTFTDKLNTAGFEGWEVINIVEIKDNDKMNPSGCYWKAWLKRKYRFERTLHFTEGQFEPETRDNVYHV